MSDVKKFPHIVIEKTTQIMKFTSKPQRGKDSKFPVRERGRHSNYIRAQLDIAWEATHVDSAAVVTRNGVYLEFRSGLNYELKTQSLENMRNKKIRLCNIRTINDPVKKEKITYATVFVPNDQKQYFYKKIKEYAEGYKPKTLKRSDILPLYEQYLPLIKDLFEDSKGSDKLKINEDVTNDQVLLLKKQGIPQALIDLLHREPKNADLIDGIEDVQKAIVKSFWMDNPETYPGKEREWCEVWLRTEKTELEDNIIEREFISIVTELSIPIKESSIQFPERTVKIIHANESELNLILDNSGNIAEFRKAKETASFWIDLRNWDQAGWVKDFLDRLDVDPDSEVSVCILDRGVNNGHPLLSPLLQDSDRHSVDPEWGTYDHDDKGHGTSMAGLAAFGDLKSKHESNVQMKQTHILESSKILPPPPSKNLQELWGYYTLQGISRAEIEAPDKKRIICMAITAEDTRDQGLPSSWSGAIDQLISGAEDETRRLMLISVGNYTCNLNDLKNYPDPLITDSIHDPAQAWNAISIGAFTNLTNLTDPELKGFHPIAKEGELSPFSTTSFVWDKKWPIKPEVVFEGGNLAIDCDSDFLTECDDFSVLTTNFKPQENLFTNFNMTSAATAQAAHFAAKIQAEYPDYWPETVRALMIHSAEWTEGLKKQFPEDKPDRKIHALLKAVGYGVPDLEKALYCANNSLTLISQQEIQPYEKDKSQIKTKDMHFYDLPWPVSVLEDLNETEVEMRITLSYYIEPGPGKVGWKDRYRYPSHLLRFEINSPTESEREFIHRINSAVHDEDENIAHTSSASQFWVIGSQNRDKGSIHSDIWKGTARELAASNKIAVFPRIGWWNKRSHLGKIDKKTRYSLIVSIRTPEQDIDIYTPVLQKISTSTSINI